MLEQDESRGARTGREPARRSEELRGAKEQARGERVPPWMNSRWLHGLVSDAVAGTCEADNIAGGGSSMGSRCMVGRRGTREHCRDRDHARRNQDSVFSRSKQGRDMCVRLWSSRTLDSGVTAVFAMRPAGKDEFAKLQQEHRFDLGVACPCSYFGPRNTGRRVVLQVHGMCRSQRLAKQVRCQVYRCPDTGSMLAWQAPKSTLCKATVVGQARRACEGACHMGTSVMVITCFAVGSVGACCHCEGLRRSRSVRCVYGDAVFHANGKHGSKTGSASRRHGAASGRQCSCWDH